MAITKAARAALGAEIVQHPEEASGVRLPNGMIKTRRGLIVPPSTSTNDTRSGALDDLTPAEEQICQIEKTQAFQPAPEITPEPEKPKTRTRRKASVQEEAPVAKPILVQLSIQGMGTVPSQYVYCVRGNGVVILGCNEYSYKPPVARYSEDGIAGAVSIEGMHGTYCYTGQTFVLNGITNLVLMQVPENHEETDNDND